MNSSSLSSLTETKFDNKGSLEYFSDDILINILSRLPAKNVIRCQKVCKRWRSLTSTPYFIELQFNMSKSFVVVEVAIRRGRQYLVLEFYNDKLRVMSITNHLMKLIIEPDLRELSLRGCSNGFMLFDVLHGRRYLIINPVTREQITLPNINSWICGFYYHPLTKQHRVLYSYHSNGYDKGKDIHCHGYKIYTLETNSWRDLPYLSHHRLDQTNPINVNGSLYWLSYKCYIYDQKPKSRILIFRFDVDSEAFETIFPPVSGELLLQQANLLEADEKLYFCCKQKVKGGVEIRVWKLDDSSKKDWIGICSIRRKIPNNIWNLVVIHICKGELIFRCEDDGLVAYNIGKRSIRKVESQPYESGQSEISCPYKWSSFRNRFSYRKSFVSLKHLKEK